MQTPSFWFRPSSWQATLLAPIGKLYAWGTARRLSRGTPQKLPIPVICVGNINAGGTGKTPTVIYLLQHLVGQGHTPHVVTRGYGGSLVGPVQVVERQHSASEAGDEPLLLSAFAPVWVSKNRLAGAQAAVNAGASHIILDDGFQDPSLHKDISLVVVDAKRGFGNQRCIPAGPLREPVTTGLARAEALVLIGEGPQPNTGKPLFHAMLEPLSTGMDWQDTRVLAFAGIGHPEKFFATLRSLGATLVHTEALADHQPLSQPLMTRLLADAQRHNARLVTTEKDAVRLPKAFRQEVLTLPVRLKLQNPEGLNALLESHT
ncbi:tetraacyldisaccharide 4'-kinase [Lentibacter algarum]|uniref:tetraacyldisaccharide 4'-kinase n=1 Tax=Lentibacter algarum TaxID=576131 RepID=UPI001C0711BF|nr:tetraacyldisaccharide 4'-kinase [Lentibacter algarum]MBU2980420.1 tetraacyldisaccharide 4'-kinase [Lentibacter algarum]